MFGLIQASPVIDRLACRLYGDCPAALGEPARSPSPVAAFKQAPDAVHATQGGTMQIGSFAIPAETVDLLLTTYWPAMLGVAAFLLVSALGRKPESGYVLGLTILVQAAVSLAQG